MLRLSKPAWHAGTGTMTLSKHEQDTLQAVLDCGGKVVLTMGRRTERRHIRTSTVNKLLERGLVRTWSLKHGYDLAVTAAGCVALNEQGERS